jgi:hypothetical protein
MIGKLLIGLFLVIIGFGVASQYYNRTISSLHGQDLGLGIAGVAIFVIGLLTIASSLFGGNPKKPKS